jgi:malate synthase
MIGIGFSGGKAVSRPGQSSALQQSQFDRRKGNVFDVPLQPSSDRLTLTGTSNLQFSAKSKYPEGVEILGPVSAEYAAILTPAALRFVRDLARTFEPTRQKLLQNRIDRQKHLEAGGKLGFLPETQAIRNDKTWRVGAIPHDLLDRRVEITGPSSDRKMVLNALNSECSGYMSDFEDSNTPTWSNMMQGQINLRDAVNGSISVPGKGGLQPGKRPTLMVRPRGWHMREAHVLIDGKPISASLFDFGLFYFHNAKKLNQKGTNAYFYLPKMESHHEAKLWDEVFTTAERKLKLPHGSTKATVLIETYPAFFEMTEILHAMKDHIAALNAGRWDALFSTVKNNRHNPDFILPDSDKVTMAAPFMQTYTDFLIKACHERGAMAIGGMAAQIPNADDSANQKALGKVRIDKQREAQKGFDGAWIAHPKLLETVKPIFDAVMVDEQGNPKPNQMDRLREDVTVTEADLKNFHLQNPQDEVITEAGVRRNITVPIRYTASWLSGKGAANIDNLMEDVATAEFRRSDLWHKIRSPKGFLQDGRKIDKSMVNTMIDEELGRLKTAPPDAPGVSSNYEAAAEILRKLVMDDHFEEFLTTPAYEHLLKMEQQASP